MTGMPYFSHCKASREILCGKSGLGAEMQERFVKFCLFAQKTLGSAALSFAHAMINGFDNSV